MITIFCLFNLAIALCRTTITGEVSGYPHGIIFLSMNILTLITPINLIEEEKRFFDSPTYQPQFHYGWNQDEINRWLIKSPKYSNLAQAIVNQETELIASVAEQLFQVPWNQELLETAKMELNAAPSPTKVEVQEIQTKYQEIVKYFGIDYAVEVVDKPGFVSRAQPSKKLILVSKYAAAYFFTLAGSARHEFTHVLRYENGSYNGISKSATYLATEEGLASYTQDFWAGVTEPSRFQHAAEYTVTEVCRKGSLRDAVEYLVGIGFPPKLAWQRAVRHKFGFTDTSRPGDIMKPAMYFAYAEKVHALSLDERLRLFVGKIALEDLPLYPEYRGKWDQTTIRDFFFGI